MSTETTVLRIGHGTSRGRDTYGYPIVSLTDERTGARVRCMGGGYDMAGTVLADWAGATHGDRLLAALSDRGYYTWRDGGTGTEVTDGEGSLYGVYVYRDTAGAAYRVSIDGGCGVDSVWRALTAAGIRCERRTHDRRGNTTGWVVAVDTDDDTDHTYTLAELRNGTGFERGARFVQVAP